MTTPWDEEFHPSGGARSTLQWAHEHGASTLGEACDLLDQLAVSNDIPEVLGHDDTVEGMREELEFGVELLGADAALTSLLQSGNQRLSRQCAEELHGNEQPSGAAR